MVGNIAARVISSRNGPVIAARDPKPHQGTAAAWMSEELRPRRIVKATSPKIKAVNAGKFKNQWDAMVNEIESATTTHKMITFDEAKKFGTDKAMPGH